MKTIKDNIRNEIIIKNSKFITLVYYLKNEEDVSNIMSSIKDEYKNASHYCYAYIIDNVKRSNDDGEPTGTAGIPILNVLEKNNLTNILCIVVRYFGGIKLGAGGLIRAYGKAVRETLKLSTLVNINKCYMVTIIFDYDDLKEIDFIINKTIVVNKNFEEQIKYTIMVKENELDIIERLKLFNATIKEIKEDYFLD
ncbi:MAG: YigZ family protein [Bacilli bacterium]|nr:YigZ family protein [Bacilli bacterium]MDD4053714.1 YigZ family protein [Bacilli bacterium]MDD4411585.1 YigZ family protein [Bacilli bacterium]